MGFLRAVLVAVLAMATALPGPPQEAVTALVLAMVRQAAVTAHPTVVPVAGVAVTASVPAVAGPLHVVVAVTVAMVVPLQLVVLAAGAVTRLAR